MDRHTEQWQTAVNGMRTWANDHGGDTYPPPGTRLADGRSLRDWAANTRQVYTSGGLTDQRIRDCESIPGWTWRRHTTVRSDAGTHRRPITERITAIAGYVTAHGHLPTRVAVDDTGHPVGGDVAYLRRLYAKGQLTAEQAAEVETGIPGWVWTPGPPTEIARAAHVAAAERRWQQQRREFQDQVAAGLLDPRLDPWAKHQRARQHMGSLAPWKEAALNQTPGWTWTGQRDHAWFENAATVKTYVVEHRRLPSVREGRYVDWLRTAVIARDRGRLTAEQKQALDDVVATITTVRREEATRVLAALRGRVEAGRRLSKPDRRWLEKHTPPRAPEWLTPDLRAEAVAVTAADAAAAAAERIRAQQAVAAAGTFAGSNRARTAAAAVTRVAAAEATLRNPPPGLTVTAARVLRRRVASPDASLSDLASELGMTKDQVSSLLRRWTRPRRVSSPAVL